MSKVFDKAITIQKIDEATEEWIDVFEKPIHACINKTKTDNEYQEGGTTQGKRNLTFEVRYFKELEDISFNTQSYRIVYKGIPFNIIDYDDYMEQHKNVKLLGVSY